MRKITYHEALREALAEEMRRDERVFLLGEDIGRYGGSFGVTEGLLDEFGADRVMDTPISETGFVGAAVGAAMTGMRPVAELMFSDFMAVCYDQIINQAAKIRYMFAGKTGVPLVLRTAQGGGTGAAAQHSQVLENMYCHVPGLKVAVPATPYDAKGLLKTAIRDNDPVIFLETKLLYSAEGEVPEDEYTVPFGKADVKRAGDDVTLITWGGAVPLCIAAAAELEKSGISAEVLDLRTLVPMDTAAVIESVKKTHRAVVVHEAVTTGGFGGEVVSRVVDSEAFYGLKAPVKRVGALDCPLPCAGVLESAVLPSAERIISAVRELF